MSWYTLTAVQQDHLLRRPFDHFARYRLAAEIVEATAGPSARVLDLGGGPGSLQAFLPDARVTSTDVVAPSSWHEQAPSLVLADGAALPFADDAFDIVVSLDTLEHVVPTSRQSFLRECARVAGEWVLVVCPYGTPGVADADTALRAYVANRFAADLPTIGILDEHLGYGHPDIDVSQALLERQGPVARIPSGRLDRWFAGMITFFHLLSIGQDEPVEVTQRFINTNFYEADLSGPAYRHGLLLRTGQDPRSPDQIIQPLLDRASVHAHRDADLSLLTTVLGEALVTSTREAVQQAAQLRVQTSDLQAQLDMTAEAERQSRDYAESLAAARAEDAEQLQQVQADHNEQLQRVQAAHDELVAFRDTVTSHPLVRARGVLKRMMGR